MLASDDFEHLLGGSDYSPSGPLSGIPAVLPYEMDEKAMAELCRLSLSMVRTKAREGVFIRSRRGRYDVAESVGRYVEALRESAQRSGGRSSGNAELAAEKLRLTRAQADAQELKNRHAAGVLVAIADVRNEWVTAATDLRAQILAIPARVSGRMGLGREASVMLEEELRAALEDLQDEH